jgi:hypothetical protein
MSLDCQGTSAQPPRSTAPRDRLKRFAAEVAAVLVQTEPLLRMIVCDADVHQVQVIWNLIEIPGKSLNVPFGRLRRFNFASLSLWGLPKGYDATVNRLLVDSVDHGIRQQYQASRSLTFSGLVL